MQPDVGDEEGDGLGFAFDFAVGAARFVGWRGEAAPAEVGCFRFLAAL